MKQLDLNIIQKILLLLILFFSGVSLHYTPNDKENNRIINHNPNVSNLSTDAQCISVNNYWFFRVEHVYGKLSDNSLLDITYDVPLYIIRKNDRKNIRNRIYDNLPSFSFVNATDARNLRVVNEDGEYSLLFDTFFLSKKYINVQVDQGDILTIKTNPIIAITKLSTGLYISCLLFVFLFLFKGFIKTFTMVVLLTLSSVFLEDSLRLISLLILLFVSFSMVRIKVITVNSIIQPLLFRPISLISIYLITTLLVGINNHVLLVWGDIIETMLLGVLYAFFLVLAILCTCDVFYTIYLFNSCPTKSITSINITNPTNKNSGRSFPMFFADFTINKSIKLSYVSISGLLYSKSKIGAKANITKYKTDGKGSYILY